MSEGRRHPRYLDDIEVKVGVPAAGGSFAGAIRNISIMGVFVALEAPIPLGTLVRLEFALPGVGTISCDATVMRRTVADDPEHTGIGVQFTSISLTNLRHLGMHVAAHEQRERLAAD
jgi:hypothetical protein